MGFYTPSVATRRPSPRVGRRLTLPILNSSSNYGIATSALPPRNDNNKLAAFQLSTFNFNNGIATELRPSR